MTALDGHSDDDSEPRVRRPKLQGTPAQNAEAEDFMAGYPPQDDAPLLGKSRHPR